MARKVSKYTLLVLLQVVVLLVAPVAATAPTTAQHSAQQRSLSDTVEPADSIYVTDNGDAVLAYNTTNANGGTVEFGANVTQGLVHILATDETESDMDAAASLVMTPDGFTGNGSLTADSPESISDLSLDVTSVQNEQKASADLTLDATFDGGMSMTALGPAHTDGSATLTGDSFRTKGTGSMTTTATTGRTQKLKYDLRETNNGFVLKASQSGEISSYMADYWSTREKAKQHLESQYAYISAQTDSDVKVTLDRYEYDASGAKPTLDIEYHVEFTGLKDALAQSIAQGIKSSQRVSLSDEQVDSIAEDIKKMRIHHVTVELNQQAGKTTVDWDVRIDNYDSALFATLEVAKNMDSAAIDQKTIDQLKTTFAARKAANLEQTVTWTADTEQPSYGTNKVTAEVHYRTKHWQAYAQEMKNRDAELGTASMDLHVESDGEEVTARGSVELKQKAMLSKITDSLVSSFGSSQSNSDGAKLIRAFQKSEFQTARVDVNVESGTLTVEGGAKFDNMNAFADVLGDAYGDATVTDIVGRTNDDTTTTYVRVKGLVGENATKADVRALAVADSDTKIYLPGEWNRSFPSMDTENAATYLGVQQENAKKTKSENESGQPGFGVSVAVVALAGAALLVRRD